MSKLLRVTSPWSRRALDDADVKPSELVGGSRFPTHAVVPMEGGRP